MSEVGFVTMGKTSGAEEVKPIGIGMLGYAFMGKAHSNAYKTLAYMTWPPPLMPQLVAIAGRNEEAVSEAARRYGFAEYKTDWKALVGDDRLLVAVHRVERERVAVRPPPGEGQGAPDLAGHRPLDLDHPGAEVGELHGGEGGGHEHPDLEDGEPVEGARPGFYSHPGTTSNSHVTGGAISTIEKPHRISLR